MTADCRLSTVHCPPPQACVLSLLETSIFHSDVAESLGEAGPDLVDYCVRRLTGLLYPEEEGEEGKGKEEEKEEVGEEVRRQVRELRSVLGLRCLSVLRYLTDHTAVLSLGVLAR